MLVNPKKISAIEIDKTNATMVAVNKNNKNTGWPNVALILFKHLEKKQDIINLFYSLTHSESTYSDAYANMIVNKMSEKIRDYFVTNAADTAVLDWNKPNEGLYALVLDPDYTQRTNARSFSQWYSLTVGGTNPDRGVTFTFRNQKIRWTEIMAQSWKLQWYDRSVKTTANRINATKVATTIKFMLGENKARYTFIKKTPSTSVTTTEAQPNQPTNTETRS